MPAHSPRSLCILWQTLRAASLRNLLFCFSGLGIAAQGLELGVGSAREPGAGLWPLIIGASLALCGASLAWSDMRKCGGVCPVQADDKPRFAVFAAALRQIAAGRKGTAFARLTAQQSCGPLAQPATMASRASDRRALAGMALACCLWIGLLLPLGWLPATLLAIAAACLGARASLAETLWLMVLLAGGLYFGVEKMLHFPLPAGLMFTLWERF